MSQGLQELLRLPRVARERQPPAKRYRVEWSKPYTGGYGTYRLSWKRFDQEHEARAFAFLHDARVERWTPEGWRTLP